MSYGQCQGITLKGLQCKRTGSFSYCWQHTSQATTSSSYTSSPKARSTTSQCKGLTTQGRQCLNPPGRDLGDYCWQHTYQAEDYASTDSDSAGTRRRCRGITLKHERCKRILVHVPGHYCWQHTDQVPAPKPKQKEVQVVKLPSTARVSVSPPAVKARITPTKAPASPSRGQSEQKAIANVDIKAPVLVVRNISSSTLSVLDSSDEEEDSVEDGVGDDSGFVEYISDTDSEAGDEDEDGEEEEEEEEEVGERKEAQDSNTKGTAVFTAIFDSEKPVGLTGLSLSTFKVPELVTLSSSNHTKHTGIYHTTTTSGDDISPLSLTSDNTAIEQILSAPPAPTNIPGSPTLEITIWTVVDLDEPIPLQEAPAKPDTAILAREEVQTKSKKSKRNRGCGFGWVVASIFSPFVKVKQEKPKPSAAVTSNPESSDEGIKTTNEAASNTQREEMVDVVVVLGAESEREKGQSKVSNTVEEERGETLAAITPETNQKNNKRQLAPAL